MVMCPPNHYVMGFEARIEKWRGIGGDDTAFNGLDIMCKHFKNSDQ